MRTYVYTQTASDATFNRLAKLTGIGEVLPALYTPPQFFIEEEKDVYILHSLLRLTITNIYMSCGIRFQTI